MSTTWLISDTHFGHRNILTFRRDDGTPLREAPSIEAHDERLVARWNERVRPEDKVYHLGDVAICNRGHFHRVLQRLHGRKVLIKGNHDTLALKDYAQHFYDLRGYHVLDRLLLAHVPVHAESLARWRGQMHGHLHARVVLDSTGAIDPRYMNVSVEQTDGYPIAFDEVRTRFPR